MKKYTREEVVAFAGEEVIARLEQTNCEPTGRVGYNGISCGDATLAFTAVSTFVDEDGDEVAVRAHYFVSNEDEVDVGDSGDWSTANWAVEYYTVG